MSALVLGGVEIALKDGDRRFTLAIDEFALGAGEAVALTGASGSGKTLLLEVLGLLRPPGRSARYILHGDDLGQLWASGPRSPDLAAQRGKLFGFVPQVGGLLPFLSVAENVQLSQRITQRLDPAYAAGLLQRLGISDVAEQKPAKLSIGQRQRTAIARALAHRPPIVIADEPTSALDPESADQVLALLLETAGEEGSAVILSSHDLDRIKRFDLMRWRLATERGAGQVISRMVATC